MFKRFTDFLIRTKQGSHTKKFAAQKTTKECKKKLSKKSKKSKKFKNNRKSNFSLKKQCKKFQYNKNLNFFLNCSGFESYYTISRMTYLVSHEM